MSSLILYSYWRSSCAYRVRIALNLKGLAYEYRDVHLVRDGGRQNQESYRALNPMSQVPCLIHQDRVLTQSLAIVAYLDRLQQIPPLFPGDPFAAARVLAFCELINAGIQPLQNLRVLQELAGRFGAGEEDKAEWSRFWMARGFAAMETQLQETAGKFCFGDEVSAADCFLVPQLYTARRYELELTAFPTIIRFEKNCFELAAFRDAVPERQPDAPASGS